MNECDCHKWYDTAEVGDWPKARHACPQPWPTVRECAADRDIWEAHRHKPGFDREMLTRLIAESGGVSHEHALWAYTQEDGTVILENGVHRWERSDALGFKRLPVEMALKAEPEDLQREDRAATGPDLLAGIHDGPWLERQDFDGATEASELVIGGTCSPPCLLASYPGGEQECDCPCKGRYHGALANVLVPLVPED